MTGKYEPANLGQLSSYMAIAKHVLNTPVDNQPVGSESQEVRSTSILTH